MRRPAVATLIALTATLCTSSCGDPLVEGDYRGQPLIEVSGTIRVTDPVAASDADRVRVALLWVGADQQSGLSQGRSESAFPARYTLEVFSAPPARAMNEISDRDGLHAIARIVVYVDDDQDERLDIEERIVGASPEQVLTYFTSSEPTSLVRGSLRSGYQVMELLDCSDSLEDKARFGTAATQTAVDLTLENGIAEGLSDLDCDDVSDDYCYDLRLQLQDDPDNDELQQVYRDRCDVDYDPTFNNAADGNTKDATTDPNTEVPLCERDPDHPDCADQNPPDETNADDVIRECKPLLAQVTTVDFPSGENLRDVYWQFAQCTAADDPCADKQWEGGLERWRDYQGCIFGEFREHHLAYCEYMGQLRENAENGDVSAQAEEEYAAAECAQL